MATTQIPVLAVLRDASDSRGWVRGLTLKGIAERAGRSQEQTRAALKYFRDNGMVKYSDPETLAALRVTKEIRQIPTEHAARMEERALRPSTPLTDHAHRQVEAGKVPYAAPREPETILPSDIIPEAAPRVLDDRYELTDLKSRLFGNTATPTFPAITELVRREAEIVEAAAVLERHGMKALADQALTEASALTPLERDVMTLISAIRNLPDR